MLENSTNFKMSTWTKESRGCGGVCCLLVCEVGRGRVFFFNAMIRENVDSYSSWIGLSY